MADSWDDRAYLRGTQYKTDANLASRQSIYAYQQPPVDLAARVFDLAGLAPSDTIADVGCGNGMYLAELARRRLPGRVLGVDLSAGMLAAARQRLAAAFAAVSASPPPPGAPYGSAVPGSPAVRVALVCGDATALPLGDGVADVTLAAHMLYHVPEPADALRELRRVTRPGGRGVIVLNGADHLHQLRAAIAAALAGAATPGGGSVPGGSAVSGGTAAGHSAAAGASPATGSGARAAPSGERVTLDSGESLARSFFGQVTRHDFTAELRVPAPGPIADYVRSLPGTRQGTATDALAAAVVAALPVTPEGHYVITTHTGCLVCVVD